MKLLPIKKIIRRYDKYSTGIDYLRMSIPFSEQGYKKAEKLIEIKNSINTTNSNFRVIYFKEHKVTFMRSSSQGNDTLSAILSYKGIAVPILYFCQYMENRAKVFNSIGKIEVMGSFFRLVEIGYIQKNSELMEWIRGLFEGGKITRLDYRIDLFSKTLKKIPKITDVVKIGKKDKWQPYMVGKNHSTGWSIGKRKHKRKLVRCYDKLIDTTEKGKFELYEDYFAYESVHRIEYELLNKELEGCTWNNVNDYIAWLLDEIGIKKKEGLTAKDVHLIFSGKEKIEEIKDKWDYYRKTKTMNKRCIQAGINPFQMLEDCIKELGYDINTIQELHNNYIKYGELSNYSLSYPN